MKTKGKRISREKSFYIFGALYLAGALGASTIGFFGDSYFAYEAFNSLWADVFFLLFRSLIYVTAFVSEILASRKPLDIVANAFIFLGCMLFSVFMFVFGGFFVFAAEIYSAILLGLIAIKYAMILRKRHYPEDGYTIDVKPALSIASLIIYAMAGLSSIDFESDIFIVWALIPAAALFIVISLTAAIMLKGYLRAMFSTKRARILRVSVAGLFIFLVTFLYSFTAVGTINCVFDGEPTPAQFTVIDKSVNSGSRTITEFEIEVSIDGEDIWISVPSTAYYNLEVGDDVTLNCYKGALGFAYRKYSGKVESQ